MEKKDLEEIAEIIREKDIFVITDEIYAELSYKEKHVSIISLPGMRERTVYINGFSKAYAMTGWRLGYACAPTAAPTTSPNSNFESTFFMTLSFKLGFIV